MNILHKLTHEWQKPWIISWFVCGVIALFAGYWAETSSPLSPPANALIILEIAQPHTASYSTLLAERNTFALIKLGVAVIGLLCVVALAFRRNLSGNGLGIVANIGEIFVQGRSGATGLMLSPVFYLTTHLYGLGYWAKNKDGDGNMIPRAANNAVWGFTLLFIVIGLFLFPWLNDRLAQYRFIDNDASQAIGIFGLSVSWYAVNVAAFVLGVSAQTAMILRYTFSWWLWIVVNFVWLAVNLMNGNIIFAIQTIIYQINAVVALYEWWESSLTARRPQHRPLL